MAWLCRRYFRQALALGCISKIPALISIHSIEYPTPVRRPAYSCLDTRTLERDFNLCLPDGRDGVAKVLQKLA